MNNRLIHIFTQAPAGLEKTRTRNRPQLLGVTLWLTIILNVINITYVIVGDVAYDPSPDVVFLVAQFLLLGLLWRGKVLTASIIFCVAMWLAIAVGFNTYSHVTQPFYYAYLLVILISGVLLSGRAAVGVSSLSIGMGLLSLGVDASGGALTMWVVTASVMIAIAIMLLVAERHLDEAFVEIEQQRANLQHQNTDLQSEIDERKRAEAALKESETRYRQLVELLPLALLVYDESGKILFTNDITVNLLGLSDQDALMKHTIYDFIVPDEHAQARHRQNTMSQTAFSEYKEYHLILGDQREVSVEVRSMRLTFEGQTGYLSVLHDVTERKQIEAERRQAEAMRIELEQQRKFVQLRENFMTMMSHEFRTPLTIIASSKDLLERHYDRMAPERRRTHYDRIGDQVMHMVEMLDDILTLSNVNAGGVEFSPHVLNINTFTREFFDEFASDVKDHELVFADHVNWGTCNVDTNLLRPILMNLLSNAVKYSPEGAEVCLELDRDDDHAVFRVKDRGVGIEDDNEIFKPFYRANTVKHIAGAGLGLAIAHRCAELHGGSIQYAPRDGGGTVFTVRLPLDCNPKDAILNNSDYNRRMS